MLSTRPARITSRQARLHAKPRFGITAPAESYVLENLDQLYTALDGMTIEDINHLVALLTGDDHDPPAVQACHDAILHTLAIEIMRSKAGLPPAGLNFPR